MSSDHGDPAPDDVYVVEHVRNALATDPRTAAQGLRVTRHGDAIVVSGTVASPDRCEAVGEVAAETAPSFRVRNETVVVETTDRHRTEELS